MDSAIILFLVQDGVINGAIYALLGVALVLVFAVTRVIFVPQGDFVAYAVLSMAALEAGRVPGAAWLLVVIGLGAGLFDLVGERATLTLRRAGDIVLRTTLLPLLLLAVVTAIAPMRLGVAVNILLTLALIVPMGPYIYRIAFQPLGEASVLVLLIASVGVHLAMIGLGLVFFGAEGYRTATLVSGSFRLGPLNITAQSLVVVAATLAALLALFLFFGRSLTGKALRASAVNRRGARLVGIAPAQSGRIAFAMAALIGALSGLLIGPITTIYFDSGFLIGLKGFVAAIIGGLVSYPLTVAAAFGVGLIEAFSSFWASAYKEVIVFTIIIPVLLLRSLTAHHSDDEEE
jgi:branched-chain amino acid transport system permease protein